MKNNKKGNEELVACVKAMIDENARISLEKIACALNISLESASSVLCNRFSYCNVSARWIPHILTPQQKRDRVAYSAVLKMYENCNPRHLDELVTSDETWIYHFEPSRKAMNKAWVPKGGDEPQKQWTKHENRKVGTCPKSQVHSEKKVLYTIFFLTQRALCCRNRARQEGDYGGVLQCSFRTEQILQKSSPNFRQVWNQTSSR